MSSNEPLEQRREQRYVASGDDLQTETFIEFNDPIEGTVIDISPHGLRLLCQGSFAVDQAFVTELKTDRLHGVFPGIIRRVDPWVDGKSVLGCELLEPIPADVLETLAREEAINRRCEDRVEWTQSAKLSYELQPGEIDVEVKDCSLGGMKIATASTIPNDVCVRMQVDVGDGEEVVIDARTVWQNETEDGCSVGLSFTKRVPQIVADVLAAGGSNQDPEQSVVRESTLRPSIMIAAAIIVCGAVLWQTSL